MAPELGIFNSNYWTSNNKPYFNTYGSLPYNSLSSQPFSFINTVFCGIPPVIGIDDPFSFFQIPTFNFQWPKINFSPVLNYSRKIVSNISSGISNGTKALKSNYSALIEKISKEIGADAKFISCIIKQESGFVANAVSHCGAKGLMQIMPFNWETLGIKDPFNPEQNIRGGTKMITGLLKSYHGDKKLALAAYNCGDGRVNKLIKKYGNSFEAIYQYLPKETQGYVTNILKNYQNCA